MKFKWLKVLPKSLFAQLALLSLIFVLLAVLYGVVLPVTRNIHGWDPISRTYILVREELYDYEADSREDLSFLNHSELLNTVASNNEHFRYFVQIGNQTAALGGPPRWKDVVEIEHPDLVTAETDETGQCIANISNGYTFHDEHGPARVFSSRCPPYSVYIEISGIEIPLPKKNYPLDTFWNMMKDEVLTSLGVFVIAFLVLGLALRSLRRVTNVAHSFNPEQVENKLPEAGVPSEVLPLIQAVNGMLDKVSESREQQNFFLATAAHEIRTPLTILRARLEEIPDGESKDELRNDVRRMSRLIEDLLRLLSVGNKGEPGDQVDLALTRQVVAERAPVSIDKGINISLESEVDSVHIRGDKRLLKVALANVIDNAVSFSESGDSVDIHVSSKGVVSIRDHGPGVPFGSRESIFKPFAKNPPNRNGHGLGFAIVKAIVNLHRGKVRVDVTPGGGATFVFQF